MRRILIIKSLRSLIIWKTMQTNVNYVTFFSPLQLLFVVKINNIRHKNNSIEAFTVLISAGEGGRDQSSVRDCLHL